MKECSATCPESNGYPVDFMRLIFGTVKLGLMDQVDSVDPVDWMD